jgi:hypothetical protein
MHTRLILTAAAGSAAIGVLVGCSGASQDALPSSPASSASLAGPAQTLSQLTRVSPASVEKDLFVSDDGSNVAVLKNTTYKNVGSITSGVDGSLGLWVDKKGNVYVGNVNAGNVTEYKGGKGSPICTYPAGDPVGIATDDAGNVYTADFNDANPPGYVDVFPQCSSSMSNQYDVTGDATGVAVDKSGDVFVAYRNPSSGGGNFEEFKSGSSSPTPLAATVGSAGGVILDKKSNLIAVDQTGSVDVIAPPYSTAKPLVSGLSGPKDASLNQKENLLFVSEVNSGVTVLKYPSGSLVTTIDASSHGLGYVEGVAESPNAVF